MNRPHLIDELLRLANESKPAAKKPARKKLMPFTPKSFSEIAGLVIAFLVGLSLILYILFLNSL